MATTFNKYFAEIFAKHAKIKDKYKPSIPEKIFETNFIFVWNSTLQQKFDFHFQGGFDFWSLNIKII